MRTHTQEFKDIIKVLGKEQDVVVSYSINGTEFSLNNEIINRVEYNVDTDILKTAMREVTIDSNVVIPKGTEINVSYGINLEGEPVERVNLGNYIVAEQPTIQEDTLSWSIKCYDKMVYSMIDYADLNITYPINVRAYIQAICNKIGLVFANRNDEFANYDKEIPYDLYVTEDGESLGYTFRAVLDELAQVTASTICINEDDELELRYITDTADVIDEEFLNENNVEFGELYGKINSIVLSRAESDNVYLRDEDSIALNGLCEIKIVDNQIMNRDDRSDYLPDILDKLDGLEYYTFDVATKGVMYYDVCDMFYIQRNDKLYKCVLFHDQAVITQGLEENIYNELPEESETDYKKADKTDRKINRAVFMVDKHNLQIQSLISQVGDRSEKTTTITQDIDGINSIVSDMEVVFDEKTAIGQITTEEARNLPVFELEIKGQKEYDNYLYSGDEYASNELYVGGGL